jgi:hypothetical protein
VYFTLRSLTIGLKRGDQLITFGDVSYFYGQMGAGKTSIARLMDYCLGGDIELSPALQSEFVAATLVIELEQTTVTLERPRESDRVIARWVNEEEVETQLSVPARAVTGELMRGTGVENLSDLLFWLSGITPPRVRQSKLKDETELGRLSIRDLLWYCYLDQDTIDSDFFHLEERANPWKRLKSRDVLRFVLQFHEEQIAQMSLELDQLRGQRQALIGSIEGLENALREVGADSEEDLKFRVATLQNRADLIQSELDAARATAESASEEQPTHAVDTLRERARALGVELSNIDDAIAEVLQAMDAVERHLHEIETQVLKFRRSVSAREVLSGVSFQACPRCAKKLPERPAGFCVVCGQDEEIVATDPTEAALLERDAKIRVAELTEMLEEHGESLAQLRKDRHNIIAEKARIERERNEASRSYDSAYLSSMLTRERERATLLQDAANLLGLARLPRIVANQRDQLAQIAVRESTLRADLKVAREAAERDSSNLDRLNELFLDCLLRAKIPGISAADSVRISTADFIPVVYEPEALEATETSFGNMSSGGKKTLFKCCFAVAVHRLAEEVDAALPKLLLIDSPMKNISERENREQFEAFHRMLYELKAGELSSTQLILIDKEYWQPPPEFNVSIVVRHMRPNDPGSPPLIPYYEGH